MDYARWNPSRNGYVYNYAVDVSSEVTTNMPAPRYLQLRPDGNRDRVRDSPDLGVKSIEISVDGPGNTWRYGYRATWNYGAGSGPAAGPIVSFTEWRHLWAVWNVVRSPMCNVDTNRIYLYGSSMGGSVALSFGLRSQTFSRLVSADFR